MNMKRYRADTMVDAMKKVRADFGEDAIIISSNVVYSKGFLGLFKKKSVEVVAGYDAPKEPIQPKVEQVDTPQLKEVESESTVQLKQEMAEMKSMLKMMQQTSELGHFPNELQPILTHLKKQGIASDVVHEVGVSMFDHIKQSKEDLSFDEQVKHVNRYLTKQLAGLPFGGISLEKKYINVLGPTGVGKTTTIAKIAARVILEEKKKVGFITTDTYRIAAIEQLRTYANLLQAPVEVIYNAKDFQEAIEKFAHLDFVFIDTAGRNYKEEKFVKDLQEVVDFSLDMETFLVLSMTSKEEDMGVIVEQFLDFPIEKFIVTKIDETHSLGALFNLMRTYERGIAYYANGQEVPEDLEEATKENIIDLLLEGVSDARPS